VTSWVPSDVAVIDDRIKPSCLLFFSDGLRCFEQSRMLSIQA
jgi:hypothetical protein